MGNLRQTLNGALGDAAGTVGQGENYANAMKEYAQAAKLQNVLGTIGSGAQKALPLGLGGGVAAGGYTVAKKLIDLLTGGGQ
jgi:hypothetical protein